MTFADTHPSPHRHPGESRDPVTCAHTAKTLDPSVRWGDVRKNRTSLTNPHFPEPRA